MQARVEILAGSDVALVPTVRELFEEYAASIGISPCFEDFAAELEQLPWEYSPPRGRLLLARVQGKPAGCVGLRPIDGSTCEMNRLYVRPEFRGIGLGRALAVRVLDEARVVGYARMRLDTLPSMVAAQRMYESLGFREVGGSDALPVDGVRAMDRAL